MIDSSVLSVSQINFYIKSMFDADRRLFRIAVSGEISNFTNHYRSGHLYFTLKDGSSALKAVMFASNAARLKFVPENGMKVICRGRIGVYERDGVYQLYADDMIPEGAGALAAAFEQLKNKLAAEGLFDEKRKKPIPEFPRVIGVITSDTGAAVQDICNILSRRYPLAKIKLYPVTVQGITCAQSNVRALEYFNRTKCADVIILGRGGGSTEDLWGYNEEILVRAVASSEIPVITGIGHETDFTLCDFASDLRAPTPSAAAELCSPDINALWQDVDSLRRTAEHLFAVKMRSCEERVDSLKRIIAGYSPQSVHAAEAARLEIINKRLCTAVMSAAGKKQTEFERLLARLEPLNPIKKLKNGFLPVYSGGKRVVSASSASPGDTLKIMTFDGSIDCTVNKININGDINEEKNI